MFLSFLAIDTQQQKRLFITDFEKLEDAFAFLTHVVSIGHTLLRAELIENNQTTQLPVAAFDGVSLSAVLEQLESTWVSVLAKPRQLAAPPDRQYMYWCRKRIAHCEQYIVELELLISSLESRCQQMSPPFIIEHELVLIRYQSVLGRYHSQLDKAHFLRTKLLNQLERSPA